MVQSTWRKSTASMVEACARSNRRDDVSVDRSGAGGIRRRLRILRIVDALSAIKLFPQLPLKSVPRVTTHESSTGRRSRPSAIRRPPVEQWLPHRFRSSALRACGAGRLAIGYLGDCRAAVARTVSWV